MQESKTREKILKKIRQALTHKTVSPYPQPDFETNIYASAPEEKEELFATQLRKLNGHFLFCTDELEAMEQIILLAEKNKWSRFLCREKQIKDLLDKCGLPYSEEFSAPGEGTVGISLCEFLVARTGSVIMSSMQLSGRRLTVYPDFHIVIARSSQLVPDMKTALTGIKAKYGDQIPSMITAITGPSRTADIEKTLVQGAHGPKEIFVFLLDDNNGKR